MTCGINDRGAGVSGHRPRVRDLLALVRRGVGRRRHPAIQPERWSAHLLRDLGLTSHVEPPD